MGRAESPLDPAAVRLAPLLDRLVNYERTRPARPVWDLAATARLLERPGASPPPAVAIQIGGSKGKGTTCAMLELIARRAGLRVGVYTSPHVSTLLERVRVDGVDVPVAELERILRDVLAAAGDRPPTFFEAMTVAAVQWFAEQRVDLAVYEVGLGGRLDATTALPVAASVLTMVELEHTDVLGDTLAKIAAEKAPIVRPGGRGFTAADGEALAVIEAHARAVGARLALLGRDFAVRTAPTAGTELAGELDLPPRGVLPFSLLDGASYEIPALALAAAALLSVRPSVTLDLRALPRPSQPCRFEIVTGAGGWPLVFDGAHTERSLAAVAAEFARRWPGQRAAILFGAAAGKRWREGSSSLLPIADRFLVTEVSGTVSEDPAAIVAHLRGCGIAATEVAGVEQGLLALSAHAGPRLVTGSFYLAGAARSRVRESASEPRR